MVRPRHSRGKEGHQVCPTQRRAHERQPEGIQDRGGGSNLYNLRLLRPRAKADAIFGKIGIKGVLTYGPGTQADTDAHSEDERDVQAR